MAPSEASRRWVIGLASGAGLYAAALYRLRPASPFEWDEVLFQRALDRFDIARHSPHPPGYPVYVAAARAVRLAVGDPLVALQITSILSAAVATILLFALARQLRSPRAAAVASAILLAATPAFLFHANVGLSDVMATAAGLATVLALVVALRDPDRLPWAALVGGLCTGVRPQFLALVVPLGLVVGLRCVRARGVSLLAKALLAGLAGVVFVWAPAVAATGTRRFWGAFGAQWNGVVADEVTVRLPQAPLSLVLESWLLDPFGARWLGISFWLLVVLGAWSWFRAGNRVLLAVAAGAATSYLLAAMWLLNLTTAARYALPALPFLALLAAGAFAVPWRGLRVAGLGAFLAWTASAAHWLMPVCLLRSEPAPVWAALGFVRHNFDPARTTVLFDPAFLPHVEYLLKGRGFNAVSMPPGSRDATAEARPGDAVLLLTPRTDRYAASLFARSWREDRLARLTGGRYEECVVSRVQGAPIRVFSPDRPDLEPPVLAARAARLEAPRVRVADSQRRPQAPRVDRPPAPCSLPAAATGVDVESPALADRESDTKLADLCNVEVRPGEDDEPSQTDREAAMADDFEPAYWPAPEDQPSTPALNRDPVRTGRPPTAPAGRRAFEAASPPQAPKAPKR